MDEKDLNVEQLNKKQTFTAKCESCGANMVFNPETQELYCSYCGSSKDFAKSSEVSEVEITKALSYSVEWTDDNSAYRCENCGAVVVLPSNQTATLCPYCGTSHVVKSNDGYGIKPNAVYPFTIGRSDAVNFAKTWAKKRLFAPKKFKQNLNAESFNGVYEPAFTFDSKTYSTYEGVVGDRRTRTVGSGKNRRVQTYTVWRRISGTFSYNFDDVIITATDNNSQQNLNKILPYDYKTIKVYDKSYLAGFMAHKAEKTVSDSWNNAKVVMDEKLKRAILSQYNYDVLRYINVSTIHNNVTYKYVLLPIYLMSFPFKNKPYNVYVNGNTGKVTGKTPISPLRVGLAVLIGAVVVFGLVALFNLLT